MTSIAGHVFRENGACSCGKRLTDISFAAYGDEWVGKPQIAHTASLTVTEQLEIRTEVERIYEAGR